MTLATLPNFSLPNLSSLGTLAGLGPYQSPGLCCCSNKFFEGAVLGRGWRWLHSAPRSWENATAAGPAAPPANKAPAEESEQLIVPPGPPPRAPGLHPRTWPRLHGHPTPAPQGGHLQWQPPHTQPGEGDEDAPFVRNSTPFLGRDQLSPSLSILLGVCKLSPHGGPDGV